MRNPEIEFGDEGSALDDAIQRGIKDSGRHPPEVVVLRAIENCHRQTGKPVSVKDIVLRAGELGVGDDTPIEKTLAGLVRSQRVQKVGGFYKPNPADQAKSTRSR